MNKIITTIIAETMKNLFIKSCIYISVFSTFPLHSKAAPAIVYSNTLGEKSAYTINFTNGTADNSKFVYYHFDENNNLIQSYVNYDWNTQNILFGDDDGGSGANYYYKWEKNLVTNNLKLVKVAPTSPEFETNYDLKAYVDSTLNNRLINTSTVATDINHSFIGLYNEDQGAAIKNLTGMVIGNITGDFIANTTNLADDSTSHASILYNYNGTIGNITGDFIGNFSTGQNLTGGAIANIEGGDIENIKGDFIGNYATSLADLGGGAIVNRNGDAGNISTIKSLTGDFIGNYLLPTGSGRGGAIYNMYYAHIGEITGNFIENYVIATKDAAGGAISNASYDTKTIGGTIENITGDFINNYVQTTGTLTTSIAQGGAIVNNIGTIGNITGDFIGNRTQFRRSTYEKLTSSQGGAISNTDTDTAASTIAKIGVITGDFISNYAFAEANLARGGAIYNFNATIEKIEGNFLGNVAASNTGAARGGAIENINGKITVENSLFQKNYAIGATTQGAVFFNNGSSGVLTVKNSEISDNFSESATGNVRGGIAENSGSGIINFDNVLIKDNYSNAASRIYGTAIYNTAILNITDSSFINNTGDVNNTTVHGPGAIYSTATINLYANTKDTIFSGNTITTSNGSVQKIAIGNNGTMNIETIGDNRVMFYDLITGGGTTNLKKGTIGFGTGGGMNSGTFVTAANTKISLIDDAINTAVIKSLKMSGNLHLGLDVNLQTEESDKLTIGNNNSGSLTTNGYNIIISELNILTDSDETKQVTVSDDIEIREAIILDDNEIIHTPDIYLYDAIAYDKSSGILTINTNGKLSLKDMVNLLADDKIYNIRDSDELVTETLGDLKGNKLAINGGNTYRITTSGGNIGGINVSNNQTLNIYNILEYTGFYGIDGAVINNSNGTVNIDNTAFTNNKVNNSGFLNNAFGGVLFQESGTSSITNSTFGGLLSGGNIDTAKNNSSKTAGGALYILAGTSNIENSKFYGNSSQLGGAIYNNGSTSITSSIFLGNKATGAGGAVDNYNGTLTIKNSTFGALNLDGSADTTKGNTSINGGAVYNALGTLSVENSNFYGNSATSKGGAFLNERNATILGGSFIGNNASGSGQVLGGAIYNIDSLSITDTIFKNNSAISSDDDALGGAIYNTGTINLTAKNMDITFSGNTANGVSNAIHNAAGGNVYITTADDDDATTDDHNIIFKDNLSGAGTYHLTKGKIFLDGAHFSSDSRLNLANNVTVSTINGIISETTFGIIDITGNAKMGLDINLETQEADTIAYAGIIAQTGEKLVLSELNLLNALTSGSDIEIVITDSIAFKDNIVLADDVHIVNSENISGFLIDYDSSGDKGILTLKYASINTAVASELENKAFSFDASTKATGNLGNMKGKALSVTSNGGVITGETFTGMTITTDQNLHISDVSGISGFSDYFITNTGGNIDIILKDPDNMNIENKIINTSGIIDVETDSDSKVVISELSGQGTTNIIGNVDFNSVSGSDIKINSGDITFNASTTNASINQIDGTTIINGVFSNSEFTQEAGTSTLNTTAENSTINLKSGTLNLVKSFSNSTNLNASGGSLNTIDNTTTTTNIGNLNMTANINWDLDVKLSEKEADKINANNITAGVNQIIINKINILSDTDLSFVEVLVSDDSETRQIITLGDEIISKLPTVTFDYDALSYDKTTGLLKINNSDFTNLKMMVNSSDTEKIYTMSANEDVTESLGNLEGEKLTIYGNGNEIIASNVGGINISGNRELNIIDVTKYSGFSSDTGAALFNYGGNVNITAQNYDVLFENNGEHAIISSGGTVSLYTENDKSITFNDNISGVLGNINVNGTVNFNKNILGNTISINSNGVASFGASSVITNSNLVVNGGRLNMINNETNTISFNTVAVNGTSKLGIDVDPEKIKADRIEAISATRSSFDNPIDATKNIEISYLNFISDADEISQSINITNGYLKDYITLADNIDITKLDTVSQDFKNGFLIEYDQSKGDLVISFKSLIDAIASDIDKKIYSLNSDVNITTALPAFNGSSMTIDGQSFEISGADDIEALAISSGKTLSFREVTLSGFKDNTAIDNDGIINIYDKTIFKSSISGNGAINIEGKDIVIDSDMSTFTGTTTFKGGILKIGANTGVDSNNHKNFFGGQFIVDTTSTATLDSQNSIKDVFSVTNWDLKSKLNAVIDIDLENNWSDSFTNTDALINSINISGVSLITDKTGKTTISLTDGTGANSKLSFDKSIIFAFSPLYKYKVDSSLFDTTGEIIFYSPGTDFNPAALSGEISTQAKYISNVNIFKEVFANIGIQSPSGKMSLSSGENINGIKNTWFRSFADDEKVDLANDIVVDNTRYGFIAGLDVPLNVSENGTKSIYSLYLGYTGSTQEYADVSIVQHGFLAGTKATFAMDNWYAGFTFNLGPGYADAENMFGKEDYQMFSVGAAAKIGYLYNINKTYTLQPSLMVTYNYIYTHEYTNSSGIDMKAQNLNAVLFSPELKISKKIENNWQMYASVSYNVSSVDSSEVRIDNVKLPSVSVEPYTEMKIGLQKPLENVYGSMMELSASVGGREGFGVEFGIKFNF